MSNSSEAKVVGYCSTSKEGIPSKLSSLLGKFVGSIHHTFDSDEKFMETFSTLIKGASVITRPDEASPLVDETKDVEVLGQNFTVPASILTSSSFLGKVSVCEDTSEYEDDEINGSWLLNRFRLKCSVEDIIESLDNSRLFSFEFEDLLLLLGNTAVTNPPLFLVEHNTFLDAYRRARMTFDKSYNTYVSLLQYDQYREAAKDLRPTTLSVYESLALYRTASLDIVNKDLTSKLNISKGILKDSLEELREAGLITVGDMFLVNRTRLVHNFPVEFLNVGVKDVSGLQALFLGFVQKNRMPCNEILKRMVKAIQVGDIHRLNFLVENTYGDLTHPLYEHVFTTTMKKHLVLVEDEDNSDECSRLATGAWASEILGAVLDDISVGLKVLASRAFYDQGVPVSKVKLSDSDPSVSSLDTNDPEYQEACKTFLESVEPLDDIELEESEDTYRDAEDSIQKLSTLDPKEVDEISIALFNGSSFYPPLTESLSDRPLSGSDTTNTTSNEEALDEESGRLLIEQLKGIKDRLFSGNTEGVVESLNEITERLGITSLDVRDPEHNTTANDTVKAAINPDTSTKVSDDSDLGEILNQVIASKLKSAKTITLDNEKRLITITF